jgi:hypothetical protein
MKDKHVVTVFVWGTNPSYNLVQSGWPFGARHINGHLVGPARLWAWLTWVKNLGSFASNPFSMVALNKSQVDKKEEKEENKAELPLLCLVHCHLAFWTSMHIPVGSEVVVAVVVVVVVVVVVYAAVFEDVVLGTFDVAAVGSGKAVTKNYVAFVVAKQVTIEDDVVTLVLVGMPLMIADCH